MRNQITLVIEDVETCPDKTIESFIDILQSILHNRQFKDKKDAIPTN